jgi:hypothetical protein
MSQEVDTLDRQDAALEQIATLLGADRHITWEPNYPEVQRAQRIALAKAVTR